MTSKITAAMVAAILFGSAGVASAQTGRHGSWTSVQAPYSQPSYDSYYNRDYWNGVTPAGRIQPRDPYVGTPFENVAPY
jgi:hypothetical protein